MCLSVVGICFWYMTRIGSCQVIYWESSKIIYRPHFIGVMEDVNGHISRRRGGKQIEKSRYHAPSSKSSLWLKRLMVWNGDISPDVNNIPRELELDCWMHFQPKGQGCKFAQPSGFISYPQTLIFGNKEALVIGLSICSTHPECWTSCPLCVGGQPSPIKGDPCVGRLNHLPALKELNYCNKIISTIFPNSAA